MANKGTSIWWNGKIVPIEDAKISLFSHVIHYGTGIFEGIRAYTQADGSGGVFRLQEHIERLFESCKILNVSLSFSHDDIIKACLAICKKNAFTQCYIRPIVFIGEGPLGIFAGNPAPAEIAILTWEWGQYLGKEAVEKGSRFKTSTFIRPHVNATMTKGKISGNYVNSVLAKSEAIAAGVDEAILLDKDGYVSEGSGENIFFVKDNVIYTTPLDSVLDGITRKSVLEHLASQGKSVIQNRFTRDELWCADEVFVTGTAAEITPIREIDGRNIGSQCPGPITKKLQVTYHDMVRGKLPQYHHWITRIE